MAKTSSEYWKKRFIAVEAMNHNKATQVVDKITPAFSKAEKQINKELSYWYARFMDSTGVMDLAEAKKLLSDKDLKELKWDINEYIKYGKKNALDPKWMTELENASAKFHISRLEALKIRTRNAAEVAFGKEHDVLNDALLARYSEDYYYTAYEIQKGLGIGFNIGTIDQNKLQKILDKPWTADKMTFSDRIWKSKTQLIDAVNTELTQMCILGKSPDEAIANISKKMQVSKNQAGRLVMTESAYFASESQKQCFNDLDVEMYEIVATLDSRTSKMCQNMDGYVFKMSEFQAGVTAPPFHVWCRSTTVPYFDDFNEDSYRAARGEDGKTYQVPANMKYEDWKKSFVDGDKSGFIEFKDPISGMTTFKYDVPATPAVQAPVKKEYLTKKKLQENIGNADLELDTLNQQFEAYTGESASEFKQMAQDSNQSLEQLLKANSYDPADISTLTSISDQIDDITAQKAEWQKKLDDKLLKEQKKDLLKKQKLLEADKITAEAEFDQVKQNQKTYSGIWKNDVTTADYAAKQGSIQAKKDYYTSYINSGSADQVTIDKYNQYLKDLDEFETEGQKYLDAQNALKKVDTELKKVQNDISNLGKPAPVASEMYTDERKQNAKWFTKFSEADAYYDPVSKPIHASATSEEHHGFYTYTSGSGGHNRPLAGFQKPWSQSGSGWEEQFYVGEKKVWIDFEGKGDDIRGLTSLIEKSSYPDDVWLQSGQDFQTIEGFLNIPRGTLQNMSDAELQQYIGRKNRIYNFLSSAVNKGGGSMFNRKPLKVNFYCPKGSELLYASDVGAFGKGENEMILQRGGSYEIRNIYWGVDTTDGNRRKIFVDMDLHLEEGYDKFQQDPSEWTGSTKNYKTY